MGTLKAVFIIPIYNASNTTAELNDEVITHLYRINIVCNLQIRLLCRCADRD